MITINAIPTVIGYRVAIDPIAVNGTQQGELIETLAPLELAGQSPNVARMLAISYVQAHPFVYLGGLLHRLVVYLVDYESGNEYLIYNNAKPTKRMLEHQEMEFHIYVWNGYQYYGWQLIADKNGDAYRVITTEDWWLDGDQSSLA